MKRTALFGSMLAALLAAGSLKAAMDIAPPVEIKWNGFAHAWAALSENAKKEDINSGVLLKRLRFKMTALPYDGVSVVILPELAGQKVEGGYGFQLLDGYIKIDVDKYILDFSYPLAITAGQFKTPFGLNRMYLPTQLAVVDYSAIYNGGTGVVEASSFWDQGLMLSGAIDTWGKYDLAWIEGLGLNNPTPGGNGYGTKAVQDFAGRVELTKLFPGLTVGGSFYHGESFKTLTFTPNALAVAFPVPGADNPKLWSGAHFKYATFGKGFSVEGEFLNRTLEKLGVTGTITQYVTDSWQLAVAYDHVTAYLNDKVDQTRYLGGVNWFPGGTVRVSLNQIGTATGPSQSPISSATVLQTQVAW